MGAARIPVRAFTKLWLSIARYFTLNRNASHKYRRFLNQNLLLFCIRKIALSQAHYFELNAGAPRHRREHSCWELLLDWSKGA